ncbi:MAG: amidohydrolase [candidate division Zixibacteria bacterium]|nr:amidohydrolase [candidate division Zixibacteria bacterium]
MTVETVARIGKPHSARRRLALIDCDIHNAMPDDVTLLKYLPETWHGYHRTNGRRGHIGSYYPRAVPHAARLDAYPPSGAIPGADLDFMRIQLLDAWNIEYGILNCLFGAGGELNDEYAAALSRAVNDWQIAEWTEPEPRLRASMLLPYETADLAVEEIERLADHPGYVQVLFLVRTREPMGHRKYWRIYETAATHGLPIGIHFGGAGGGPITGAGWPSHYIEDHGGMPQAFQAQVVSLVLSGILERIPELKIVLIEGGFGWLAPLMWRLDGLYEQFGDEMPQIKRKPSDYIRKHIWLTTQPIEEPPEQHQFDQLLEQMDMDDRLMFATDYPHWDFDAPTQALIADMSPKRQKAILAENARALYRLD